MIICKLSALLGDKRIKVSDLVRATGIARATLDRYYYDRVGSFDREVLEKLCRHLQVPLSDLLVEIPDGESDSKPEGIDSPSRAVPA